MKSAILYIRVSTDEQTFGYSPRHQEEMLTRYCSLHNIHIRQIVLEDYSAKNFDRPAWNKMELQLRKEKNPPALLLFTKWDRFSRNAGDAYAKINFLNRLGVDPQAIEQPLDLAIPENKMMLAFYLASPEVENHRRSLNVSSGMRRALKEGRYMGKAPLGYINRQADRKKWIEPDPATAAIIAAAFEEVALGKFSVESILKFTRAKGIKCSKNNFWTILRNQLYCGKIFIPAWKDEQAEFVTGQHQPLISAHLFNQVQDVLDGKKKLQKTKKTVQDKFPLRGFIECHSDGKLLTASSSKGRKQYYDYYHCTSSCGTRHPAAALNDAIVTELRKWKAHPAVKHLHKLILKDVLEQSGHEKKQKLQQLQKDITHYSTRQARALDMLLTAALDPDDYRAIKRECEASISKLEAELSHLMADNANLAPLIDAGVEVLDNIDQAYLNSSTYIKRQIIGSIFPEKLVFDGSHFRTARVNEVVQLIYNLGAAFSQKETGQSEENSQLSREVIPPVHFSNHFIHDLRKLANLYSILKSA